jgi:AraC family transcriptional regulator
MRNSFMPNKSYDNYAPSMLDWYSRGKLSKYLDGAWSLGAYGSNLIDATQPIGDMSDPALPQISLGYGTAMTGSFENCKMDVGAGAVEQSAGLHSSLIVIPPMCATSFLMDVPQKVIMLSFNALDFKLALENSGLSAKTDLGFLHTNLFQDEFLMQGLIRLRDWCSPEHAGFALAKEGLLLAMILRMAELSGNSKLPVVTARQGTLARWQIKRILEQLQANLAHNPTLDELAHSIGLSKFHFSHAFKQTLGRSPMQYLIEQRMEQATILLKNSKMPIADIAAQVGYDDPAYFARLYRSRASIMPSEVRRQSQHKPKIDM